MYIRLQCAKMTLLMALTLKIDRLFYKFLFFGHSLVTTCSFVVKGRKSVLS